MHDAVRQDNSLLLPSLLATWQIWPEHSTTRFECLIREQVSAYYPALSVSLLWHNSCLLSPSSLMNLILSCMHSVSLHSIMLAPSYMSMASSYLSNCTSRILLRPCPNR